VSKKPKLHPNSKDRKFEETPEVSSELSGKTPSDAQPGSEMDDAAAVVDHELEALREQLQETQNRALRFQADLENYRKRADRQMEEERRYAALPLMRDLLPVLDNMGRAIESAEKTHDTASLLEGIKMVFDQFQNTLHQHHCTEIEAFEQPFDPNRHQAIAQQPSEQHPPNTVLMVTQTGFMLHDRVVRPTQVIVSTVPAEENNVQSEGETDENASR